jgi:gluconate kinase
METDNEAIEKKKRMSRPYRGAVRSPYTHKLFVYVQKGNDQWVRRMARKKEFSMSRFMDEMITKVRKDDLDNGPASGI